MSQGIEATPLLPVSITPELARAYLENVATGLGDIVIPALSGAARARAIDCLKIVSRMLSNGEISEEALSLLADGAALAEGKLIEQVNHEADVALAGFLGDKPQQESAEALDPAPLEAWLRAQTRGGDGLRVTAFRKLSGGRSKITMMAELEGAQDLPRRIVIRQDGPEWITGKKVVDEDSLLARLHAEGLRVPEPLLLEASGKVLGKPFLVVPALPGVAVGEHFLIIPKNEQAFLQLADQLARLHSLPIEDFAAMESIREANYTAAELRESLAGYRAIITQLDLAPSALLTAVYEWLDQKAPEMSVFPRALVHADAGFHNVLIDGDQISVVLDWELAHIGHPAYDLGYIRHGVLDPALWDRFMARYRAAGGLPITEDCVEYFTLFTGVWYHHLQLRARSAVVSGALRNIEIAALNADFGPRVLGSISRAFHRITNAA